MTRRGRKLLVDVVRDELREWIADGVYQPGDKLPGEHELGVSFNVSRMTLREAVRGLVEEGYLTRQHGLGTYVTQKPTLRNNLDVNFGVTHLIESAGMKPGNRDVSINEEPAGEEVAAALGLETGAPIVRIERVRTADGAPVLFSIEYIPSALLPRGKADVGKLRGSLYAVLADLDHPVHHGVVRIRATEASAELAERLQTTDGTPLLCLEQVDYKYDETPVLLSYEWYRDENFEMTVYRRGVKS